MAFVRGRGVVHRVPCSAASLCFTRTFYSNVAARWYASTRQSSAAKRRVRKTILGRRRRYARVIIIIMIIFFFACRLLRGRPIGKKTETLVRRGSTRRRRQSLWTTRTGGGPLTLAASICFVWTLVAAGHRYSRLGSLIRNAFFVLIRREKRIILYLKFFCTNTRRTLFTFRRIIHRLHA